MAKGLKIDNMIATVIDIGSGCVGNMEFETPYVKLDIDGKEYIWQSANAENARFYLNRGSMVRINAFAYYENLRRVSVLSLSNFQQFGMVGKFQNAPKRIIGRGC